MMTHPYDDIEAYALGSLEQQHAQRVLEHADGCPTCAVLMADAMAAVHSLMGSQPERSLPTAGMIQRLLRPELFHPTPSARSRVSGISLLSWPVAAVSLAVCFALLYSNAQLRSNAQQVPIATLVHSHFTHHALHGATGSAKVIQGTNGQWLYVVADGLIAHRSYTLSEIAGGRSRVLGNFLSTDSGTATAYWQQSPARIDGLVIAPAQDTGKSGTLRWP